jgi:hypothetical protein
MKEAGTGTAGKPHILAPGTPFVNRELGLDPPSPASPLYPSKRVLPQLVQSRVADFLLFCSQSEEQSEYVRVAALAVYLSRASQKAATSQAHSLWLQFISARL